MAKDMYSPSMEMSLNALRILSATILHLFKWYSLPATGSSSGRILEIWVISTNKLGLEVSVYQDRVYFGLPSLAKWPP